METNFTRSPSDMVILALTACAAGFTNGLLGSGGGILLIFVMSYVLKRNHIDLKDIMAVNISAVIAMCAVSCAMYAAAGRISAGSVLPYILPAAAGGLCGAFLLDRLEIKWLRYILSAITIWAGWRMIRA